MRDLKLIDCVWVPSVVNLELQRPPETESDDIVVAEEDKRLQDWGAHQLISVDNDNNVVYSVTSERLRAVQIENNKVGNGKLILYLLCRD